MNIKFKPNHKGEVSQRKYVCKQDCSNFATVDCNGSLFQKYL